MAELDRDLQRQIEGIDSVVSPQVEASAASFVANMRHLETHGHLGDPSTNPTPNRRGFSFVNTEGDQFIAGFRGVDWIGAGQDDGSFLSPVSDEEYEAVAETGRIHDLPERHPIAIADLFPSDWDGAMVVYDISVRARRLTEKRRPVGLQEGQSQEIQPSK